MIGGSNLDNEYILTVQLPGRFKIYRVYAPNKGIAIQRFVNVCNKYMNTDNDSHKEYWENLKKAIDEGSYKITMNEDFCGVREII